MIEAGFGGLRAWHAWPSLPGGSAPPEPRDSGMWDTHVNATLPPMTESLPEILQAVEGVVALAGALPILDPNLRIRSSALRMAA